MGLEAKLQQACVEWFRYKYENSGKGIIVAIINEGRRSAKTGGRLKRQGLACGAPDLFVIKKGSSRILFIEMKTTHRQSELSPEQIEFHDKLRDMKQVVFVCRTLDEFMRIVDSFFTL